MPKYVLEDAFFKSATLRHCIWYKKEILKEQYPWSNDERFNTVFFCNVFRRIDKTTKTIVRLISKALPNEKIVQNADGSISVSDERNIDFFLKLIVARNLSNNETLKYLESNGWFAVPYNRRTLDILLYNRAFKGEAVHTSGFLVYSGGMRKFRLPGYVSSIIDPQSVLRSDSIEECWNTLVEVPYIGPFMAYEYATDLSYFIEYPDKQSWSNPGPGAYRGMIWIMFGFFNKHDKPNVKSEYQSFSNELLGKWNTYVREQLYEDVQKEFPDSRYDTETCVKDIKRYFLCLTMREVEHWLCEFDKYCRKTRNKRVYPHRS